MRTISPRQAMARGINRCNQRLDCLFDVGHSRLPLAFARLSASITATRIASALVGMGVLAGAAPRRRPETDAHREGGRLPHGRMCAGFGHTRCNTCPYVSGLRAATSATPSVDLRLVSAIARVQPQCRSWYSCWSGVQRSIDLPLRDGILYPSEPERRHPYCQTLGQRR